MSRYVVSAALLAVVAAGSFAAPATAVVPCQEGDLQCYRECYLPHVEGKDIYWVNC